MGRTVVSVVMNTGETMLKVFTLVVVYPRHSRSPRVQRSQAAEWEQPKPGSQAQRKVLMAAPVPVPGGPVPAEVVEGGAEPGGGITSNSI